MDLIAALLLGCLLPPDPTEAGLPRSLAEPVPVQGVSAGEPSFSVGLSGRLTLQEGTISNPDYFVEEVTFSDLFDTGQGFRLEFGLLWTAGPSWSIGPFLVLGLDSYGGSTYVDGAGDTIRPRDLDSKTILVGFRGVYGEPVGFFTDVRAALGALMWSGVEADFVVGGTPFPAVNLLSDTTAFAFEFGGRIGYRAGTAVFTFGIELGIAGGPDRGTDVTDVIDPSAMVGVAFELGIELIF